MEFFRGTEYEYARHLVFFGFLCGMAFSALLVVIVQLFNGDKRNDSKYRD